MIAKFAETLTVSIIFVVRGNYNIPNRLSATTVQDYDAGHTWAESQTVEKR